MELSERIIEDVFEVYYKQLLSPDLVLIDRQHVLKSKLRIDLLFRDKKGRNVVLELKKDAVTREDIGQTLQYAGEIRNSRVILAAPFFASSVKTAFEHYGIEYLEFDLNQISKLHKQIKSNGTTPKKVKTNIQVPQNVVKTPLRNSPVKDGNVAFKVTYVDSNWRGVCSDKLYHQNCFGRFKKTWCSIQAGEKINCRSQQFSNLTQDILKDQWDGKSPCIDSIALTGRFVATVLHPGGKAPGKHTRSLQAKVGKLAIFTSREPGESAESQFIFMIAPIRSIYAASIENPDVFDCDVDNGIIFDAKHRPKFWDYYYNAGNPERIAWNTGLLRYVNDRICYSLLSDVLSGKFAIASGKSNARKLIGLVK